MVRREVKKGNSRGFESGKCGVKAVQQCQMKERIRIDQKETKFRASRKDRDDVYILSAEAVPRSPRYIIKRRRIMTPTSLHVDCLEHNSSPQLRRSSMSDSRKRPVPRHHNCV